MSETSTVENLSLSRTGNSVCQVCKRQAADQLIPLESLSESLRTIIRINAVIYAEISELCPRCVSLFERARLQIEAHADIYKQGGRVLPTPLRLDADERYKGRGITIAFLDSGFYAHPDLTTPRNRILAYHSVVENDQSSLDATDSSSWHGMMTSVIAAGNGNLSNGLYRSIAPEAELVLVKVGTAERIPEVNIKRGLDWVIKHREQYNIRIVNISVGGDEERSYLHAPLSRTVERAVRKGLIVVCAVGNAGATPNHAVIPPANAPSSIAVGGVDDHNSLNRLKRGMYRSSYGPTIDGLQKPEVIAPGMWVAAPILPRTTTSEEAALYAELDTASNDRLCSIIESHAEVDRDLYESRNLPVPLLRQLISIKLHEGSIIDGHYKYVDGTSFAAPTVSSIIACMLEVNPKLSPQQVKRISMDTAERLVNVETDRQGWGVITARRAIEHAELSVR